MPWVDWQQRHSDATAGGATPVWQLTAQCPMPAGGKSRSPLMEAQWWLLPFLPMQKDPQSSGQLVVLKQKQHEISWMRAGGEEKGGGCSSTELTHPWSREIVLLVRCGSHQQMCLGSVFLGLCVHHIELRADTAMPVAHAWHKGGGDTAKTRVS